MSSESEDSFDPEIPRSKLPDSWEVRNPYQTTIRLHSRDSPDHIILQPWEEDGGTTYVVTPMVESDATGATAENDQASTESFDHLKNAIDYAVSLANRLAQ